MKLKFWKKKTRKEILKEFLKENWSEIADSVLGGRNIPSQLDTLRQFSRKNSDDIAVLGQRISVLEGKSG